MLLLAWSLFHHAIRFGRRQRMASLLQEALSGGAGKKSICCRCSGKAPISGSKFKNPAPIHPANTILHRVPSEPILPMVSADESSSSSIKGSRQLYCDDQREIVEQDASGSFLTDLQLSDWALDSPFGQSKTWWSNNRVASGPLIYFVVRVSYANLAPFVDPTSVPTSSSTSIKQNCNFLGQMPSSTDVHSLTSFARPFAQQRSDPAVQLFAAPLPAFVDLVFCWSEGTLFGGVEANPNFCIEEIRTVPPPHLWGHRHLRPSSFHHRQKQFQSSIWSNSPSPSPRTRRRPTSATMTVTERRRRPPSLLELLFQREEGMMDGDEWKGGGDEAWGRRWHSEQNCANNNGSRQMDTTDISSFGDQCQTSVSNHIDHCTEEEKKKKSLLMGDQRHQKEKIDADSATTTSNAAHSTMKTIPSAAAATALRRTFSPEEMEIKQSICDSSSSHLPHPPHNNSNILCQPLLPPHFQRARLGTVDCTMLSNSAAKFGHPAHHLSRSASVMPSPVSTCVINSEQFRRRSLSPLTISLLVNYGSGAPSAGIGSTNSPSSTALLADPYFPGKLPQRRVHSTPRRSFGSIQTQSESTDGNGDERRSTTKLINGGLNSSATNESLVKQQQRPQQKPPSLLVYSADSPELFAKIRTALRQIIARDTYTIATLSTRALIAHPWMDNCACLIIADTTRLDDAAWTRLQSYFVNSGKMLFVCENSLLASLTNSHSHRQQSSLIKNAFGNKSITATMGKEFGSFLKRALKGLAKNGEINETFYTRDSVGDSRFSVVLFKKKEQPLLLYMHNLGQRASALFSDATTEQLLWTGNGSLIRDALQRLGLKDILDQTASMDQNRPPFSPGYLIAQKDTAILDIPGMTYDKLVGMRPRLWFHRSGKLPPTNDPSNSRPTPSTEFLPIEIRRRRDGVPSGANFDVEIYYGRLVTKRLGQLLLFVPVCETTMELSSSLSYAFPLFDGILVVAGYQLVGKGRAGNEWLSPAGAASFTFNFNIPFASLLGRSICFLQHITGVAVASAVAKLLAKDVPDFPIKLKWPNDIYYDRSYKLGGIMVQASQRESSFQCLVGVGLNVTNSKPTICINDMLPVDSNRLLTVEEVLAVAMNEFEHYVNLFENKGKAEFLKMYYRFWMHSHEEVKIERKEDGVREKVVIRGLDEHGYLEVRSKETGQIMSVMDDGNSFDIFHGLIAPKNGI